MSDQDTAIAVTDCPRCHEVELPVPQVAVDYEPVTCAYVMLLTCPCCQSHLTCRIDDHIAWQLVDAGAVNIPHQTRVYARRLAGVDDLARLAGAVL